MAADPVRFPLACPACSAVTAMPHAATTTPDGGTSVGMRCRHCGHEWRYEMEATVDLARLRSGVRLPIAKKPS
jgi:RNase P subunit RPR2